MNAPLFIIEDNIPIPARTIPNAGPRESMYPLDQLKVNQGFGISLAEAKEKSDEGYAKLGRQKQSQLSALARKRNVKLQTRVFLTDSPFPNVPAPALGVWRVEGVPAAKAPKAAAAAPEAPAAPEIPAAPAAAGDDVLVL